MKECVLIPLQIVLFCPSLFLMILQPYLAYLMILKALLKKRISGEKKEWRNAS